MLYSYRLAQRANHNMIPPLLMRAQIAREMLDYPEATLLTRIETLRNALSGIASCATQCGCCQMHVRIAERVLEADAGGGR